MQLVVQPNGSVRCLYDEAVDLHALGQLSIERGSYVEPTNYRQWNADLSPVNGPILGPYDLRSEALDAERGWLTANWLL